MEHHSFWKNLTQPCQNWQSQVKLSLFFFSSAVWHLLQSLKVLLKVFIDQVLKESTQLFPVFLIGTM